MKGNNMPGETRETDSLVEPTEVILARQKDEIVRHLKEGGVKWIRLESLFNDEEQSCVDGRDLRHVIGTPGGDMGSLLAVIAAAENVMNEDQGGSHSFSKQEVKEIFRRYHQEFGAFYMHTDEHALEHLVEHIKSQHAEVFAVDEIETASDMEEIIRSPQSDEQKVVLLDLLTRPEFIGCGHLKLATLNPEVYNVDLEVLAALTEAFYETMWDEETRDKVDYVVLQGGHAEKLVLVVNVDESVPLRGQTMVPAVQPLNEQTGQSEEPDEMFIYHPQVSKAIDRRTALVIVANGIIPGMEELMYGELIEEIDRLSSLHLDETVGRLAPHLNIWSVTLTQDENGEPVVSEPEILKEGQEQS